MEIDRSIEADAKRFRWLLDGNGYFMEEGGFCGHESCDDKEKDEARIAIDEMMEKTSNVIPKIKNCNGCKMSYPLEYIPGFGWYHKREYGPDIECTNPEVKDKPNPEEEAE